VYHGSYQRSLAAVPLDPKRAERVLSFLADEGLVARQDIRVPRRPQVRAFLRVHDADYLERLQRTDEVTRIFGTPVSDLELSNIIEMQRMMSGGTIFATKIAVREGGVVFNLGGGFHHALRDSGMGFCLVNDIAVAIARLRSRGFSDRVLVVDLDMHDGNGTRAIFARDPSVHTYSIHADHWGEPEADEATAIALGDDVEDEVLLGTLLKTLPDVVESVDPSLVIYLAGADPAADDALGNWRLTAAGMLSRDRFVMDLLRGREHPVPVVVVLGGGYGDRSWTYTARFASWSMTGRAIEPPANEELVLRRFRRIWQTLDPAALTSEPDDSDWRITEEDLGGIVPEAARETRFLGYERFGIMDQLRARGYKRPVVAMDLDHPLGQNLRIFGDTDRAELLMELRANRNTTNVPGCEVLVVEWLLLQNPRAHFGPYRRPLPGQNHPGLGMLREVFGWLVVVCEKLGLDGIHFTPTSFHVATQSRRSLRFLNPEHEARYRAYRDAVSGLGLAEASQAVAEGGVVDDESGDAIEWEGLPTVLPVSERLQELVYGEEYEARVTEELEKLRFRLVDRARASVAAE
jgi:acetoin utilization deacetylase AcuC-like enzyme